jgi:predicted Zn-dependent protease
MDPGVATNPDPNADKQTAEDEAEDAPETTEDAEKRAPAAPVLATTVAAAVQQIKDGKRDLALSSLNALWKKSPKSSYIPFLLGNLYFDKLWWAVAMDHYKAAISKNGGYRSNAVLNRNVIKMLGSPRTVKKATGFIRTTIGKPAIPYLKQAAKSEPNDRVRKTAASLAKTVR